MGLFKLTVLSLCTFTASVSAAVIMKDLRREFFVTAPETIRLGSEENIAVAIEGETNLLVNVTIRDSLLYRTIFYQSDSVIAPGKPELFRFKVHPAEANRAVSIIVESEEFRADMVVKVEYESGFVFIQTDRPIYSPGQKALLRIVYLNDNTLPSGEPFKFQIKNPQNILVEETLFNETKSAFVSHSYEFPMQSPLGEWTASVRYGYMFRLSTSVRFDLGEYVLPTFTATIETPDYIFPDTEFAQIHIHAKSVHGKKVDGFASLSIKLLYLGESEPIRKKYDSQQLVDGSCTYKLNVKDMLPNGEEWKNWVLDVKAEITEKETEIKKLVTNDKCIFITRKLQLKLEDTQTCFKPGIIFHIKALILNDATSPVSRIPVIVEGSMDEKEKLDIIEKNHISDPNGIVYFRIQTETNNTNILVKVKTNSTMYENTEREFLIPTCNPFLHAFIAIERTKTNKFRVGETISRQIYFEPSEFKRAYLTVSSKGKIIYQEAILKKRRKTFIEIPITRDMVPSAKISVFASYERELVADSIEIETEDICDSTRQVSIDLEFDNKEPGASGKIVLHGIPNTLVGLLAVDEAIYALSKKDILSTSKVICTLGTVSRGVSNGYDTLEKAGLLIASEFRSSFFRDIQIVQRGPRHQGTIVPDSAYVQSSLQVHAFAGQDVPYIEKTLKVRHDFRDTWFFQDIWIGSEGVEKYDVTLPDSITTWKIQAISVSQENGLCIAKPQTLISTKKIFLQLNLPNSAKKNEQILITATLFNYGILQIAAIIYINGSDHLRVTEEGAQGREEKIRVNAGSAVTVTFPVTPLEEGKIPVNVTSITTEGSDVISRILDVMTCQGDMSAEEKLYPTNDLGDQYYPPDKNFYAKTPEGIEKYARKRDQTEFYRKENGNEIYIQRKNNNNLLEDVYATKLNGDEIYAKDKTRDELFGMVNETEKYAKKLMNGYRQEYCPRTKDNTHIYKPTIDRLRVVYPKNHLDISRYNTEMVDGKEKEIYFLNTYNNLNKYIYRLENGMEKYAKDENGREYCALWHDKPYYATDAENREYLPDSGYIIRDGKPIYPVDKTKNVPIYKLNELNHEIYHKIGEKEYYAYVEDTPYYAKLANHEPYFAKDEHKLFYYAKKGDKEIYPLNINKDQFYLQHGMKEIYAKDENHHQYYAQLKNHKEIPAKEGNTPYYAQDQEGNEIYPHGVDGGEYYIRIGAREEFAKDKDLNGRYAKNILGDEFYPNRFDFLEEPVNEDREPSGDVIYSDYNVYDVNNNEMDD